jgi:hypothetical protein
MYSQNPEGQNAIDLLQANNIVANSNSTDDCDYLRLAVESWLQATVNVTANYFLNENYGDETYVIWAQLLPIRCDWQNGTGGVITKCIEDSENDYICNVWKNLGNSENATREDFSEEMGIRAGELLELDKRDFGAFFNGTNTNATFYVRAIFNESNTVAYT